MLQVDLAVLAEGPVDTLADLAQEDPLFDGVEFRLGDVVQVAGRLQSTGEGRYYWRATISTTLACECRRCLAPVRRPIQAKVDALFSEDPDALDDPAVYAIPHRAKEIDLRPAVREELILAVPEWVACREDCRGLCPRCGADLNAGPCGCPPEEAVDPRWAALKALQPRPRE